MSALDDATPREVWLEYSARKVALSDAHPLDYALALEQLADELGCGIPPHALSDAQRRAQSSALARHGSTWCSP